MRCLAPLILAALSVGCQRAHIIRCEVTPHDWRCDAGTRDGGPDDGAARDAGAGDAASLDASIDAALRDAELVPDPYPTLFRDDFDDGDISDWIIGNPLGGELSPWTAAAGALFSGPGRSSAFWNAPECPSDVGPALIRSTRTVPVGDGRFTIEADVYSGADAVCGASLWIGLSDPLIPTEWRAEPYLGLEWGRALGNVSVRVPSRSTEPTRVHPNRILGPRSIELRAHGAIGIAELGRWYRVHIELCANDGYYVRLSTLEGEVLLQGWDRELAFIPSPTITHYDVELMAEGNAKGFDNVVVRRGCPTLDAR